MSRRHVDAPKRSKDAFEMLVLRPRMRKHTMRKLLDADAVWTRERWAGQCQAESIQVFANQHRRSLSKPFNLRGAQLRAFKPLALNGNAIRAG